MGLGLGLGGLGLDSQGLIDQAKAHGVSGILMDISEVRKQPVADWRRQLADNSAVMHDALHLHIDECPAGEGCLNYADIIALVDEHLRPDTYMVVEHTPLDKLPAAMACIRESAAKAGVAIV